MENSKESKSGAVNSACRIWIQIILPGHYKSKLFVINQGTDSFRSSMRGLTMRTKCFAQGHNCHHMRGWTRDTIGNVQTNAEADSYVLSRGVASFVQLFQYPDAPLVHFFSDVVPCYNEKDPPPLTPEYSSSKLFLQTQWIRLPAELTACIERVPRCDKTYSRKWLPQDPTSQVRISHGSMNTSHS